MISYDAFHFLSCHISELFHHFQVWKAELVLSDFVLHKIHTSSEFQGIVSLELGAGTGTWIFLFFPPTCSFVSHTLNLGEFLFMLKSMNYISCLVFLINLFLPTYFYYCFCVFYYLKLKFFSEICLSLYDYVILLIFMVPFFF